MAHSYLVQWSPSPQLIGTAERKETLVYHMCPQLLTVCCASINCPPPQNHTHTAVMHPGSPYQLPFIVFGLGETPNFIEDLTIGAGHASGSNGSNRTAGYHQWASLVPNSQVIVITTPPDNPGRYGWLA